MERDGQDRRVAEKGRIQLPAVNPCWWSNRSKADLECGGLQEGFLAAVLMLSKENQGSRGAENHRPDRPETEAEIAAAQASALVLLPLPLRHLTSRLQAATAE